MVVVNPLLRYTATIVTGVFLGSGLCVMICSYQLSCLLSLKVFLVQLQG